MLTKYREEVAPALQSQFAFKNRLQIPALTKIVINMGVGKAVENKSRIDHALRELTLRDGNPVGVAVTLRGARMWEFVDRLISVAIPRIRDFRGFPKKLDGQGNYSLGLSEQSIFPEINLDKIEFTQGMHVTFVTTARTDEEGSSLLEKLGFPFKK
ncbi:MAG: large ribosomal subunit protein uL5 [Planctomycetota bacterium]|jgi:large subunit ribosomal protein L5